MWGGLLTLPNRPSLSLAGGVLETTGGCASIGQSDPVWFELGFEDRMERETPLVNDNCSSKLRRSRGFVFTSLLNNSVSLSNVLSLFPEAFPNKGLPLLFPCDSTTQLRCGYTSVCEMKSLSCVRLFATPTVAYQAAMSMRFSRQEYWSRSSWQLCQDCE